jgi:predicted nuclease of restriction endonuclease-like (RecB) superfamily
VRAAQYQALQAVNREQLQLYWDLGQLIAERQQQAGWGKKIVETLAHDLQTEFVGLNGFSASNLWRMLAFYLAYAQEAVLAPLVRELGWSLNVAILEKTQSAHKRGWRGYSPKLYCTPAKTLENSRSLKVAPLSRRPMFTNASRVSSSRGVSG